MLDKYMRYAFQQISLFCKFYIYGQISIVTNCRPPKCSVHTSGSGRSSRATSAPPQVSINCVLSLETIVIDVVITIVITIIITLVLQSLAVTEVKEKSVEKSNRQVHIEMKIILWSR